VGELASRGRRGECHRHLGWSDRDLRVAKIASRDGCVNLSGEEDGGMTNSGSARRAKLPGFLGRQFAGRVYCRRLKGTPFRCRRSAT
jgi:hypothetical protein